MYSARWLLTKIPNRWWPSVPSPAEWTLLLHPLGAQDSFLRSRRHTSATLPVPFAVAVLTPFMCPFCTRECQRCTHQQQICFNSPPWGWITGRKKWHHTRQGACAPIGGTFCSCARRSTAISEFWQRRPHTRLAPRPPSYARTLDAYLGTLLY